MPRLRNNDGVLVMGDLLLFPDVPWTQEEAIRYLGIPIEDSAWCMRPATEVARDVRELLEAVDDRDLRRALAFALGGHVLLQVMSL